MRKRPYSGPMAKDENRGGRTGRNVQFSGLISEQAAAVLEAWRKRMPTKGTKNINNSEALEDFLLAHKDSKEKPGNR